MDQPITFERIPSVLQRLAEDIDLIKNHLGKSSPAESSAEAPLDVEGAKNHLNLENVQTIYRMVREGRIPFYKCGSRLFFFKSELNAWIKSHNTHPLL